MTLESVGGAPLPALIRRGIARRWRTAAGLFVIALGLYTWQLGSAAIVGDDEARDAAVVSEMAVGGHWLVPLFNGTLPPEKPPLFYWLAALNSRLAGGVTEFSVRLPSAVAAAGTVAVVFIAGGALVGDGAALLAAVMLVTAPLFVGQARLGRTDMTLTFCTTGFLFAAAQALRRERGRGGAFLAWLWLTLSVLAKGGAGLGVCLAGVSAAVLVLRERPSRLWSLPGVGLFLVLVGGWHLYAWMQLGDAFVRTNLLGENAAHLVGWRQGALSLDHWGKPTGVVLGGAVPWTALALWPLVHGSLAWRQRGVRLLLAWSAGGLVFFSLASGRHSYYELPLMPPFVLLLGSVLNKWRVATVRSWSRAAVVGAVGAAGVLTALFFAVAAWWRAHEWWGMSASDRLVAQTWTGVMSGAPRLSVAVVFAGLLVASVALAAILRRRVWLGVAVTWVPLYIALAVSQPLEDQRIAATDSLKPFALVVRQTVCAGDAVYFYGQIIRGVVFYTGRHIPVLETEEQVRALPSGACVIATARARSALGAETAARLAVRYQGSGRAFNLGVEPVYLLQAR